MVDPKPARLLVVEDEIITARDLQDSLEELGYDVPDIASCGGEALELAESLRPDLVLMDINLGAASRDGVEVAEELRERHGLPVIYLTAYADAATLSRAAATAPLGYLTKPFERRELHATIQMALVKRQLDDQLRQSESWYSTSLSSIGDGVIATDASGRVKFVNPVAAALTGWPHAEALGRPLEEVFPLSDRTTGNPRPGLTARVLDHGEMVLLEEGTMLRARDGSMVPIDDSAAPIRDARGGGLLGVVVVFRDLSEKQQIAAELERARRLESLGTLAGGLAHDLNNILAIIDGNVSLANRPGAPVDAQTRAFAKIDAAVRRAKALTSQFLTFSKGGEPVRRPVDLRTLLREEIDLVFGVDGDAPGPRCQPRLEIGPGLWTVEADDSQLRRVVENFLRNAVQALPVEGGTVTVRALNCAPADLPGALAAEVPDRFLRVEVSDTGCGIPPENLPHVCDPYFTTRATGSGLGLSVCHSIARKHDGCLRLQSTVGEGTTAAIFLPAKEPAVSKAPPPVADAKVPAATGLRVLIMDDEPMMCELLARMMTYFKHEAVTAPTGEEALRLYAEAAAAGNGFDVVLIDLVNKLGMGGQEMMARLREADPGVVAIVCSGYCDHPIMAHHRSYGFSACLRKPIRMEDLIRGLKEAMAAGV